MKNAILCMCIAIVVHAYHPSNGSRIIFMLSLFKENEKLKRHSLQPPNDVSIQFMQTGQLDR